MKNIEHLRFDFHGPDGLAIYPPGATFGPRILSDFEFVWIIDGRVEWECNGVWHPAPPGTIILSRPGTNENYRWDPEHITRHAFFHFALDRRGAVLPPESEWPTILQMPDNDILRPLFRHLAWLMRSKNPDLEPLAQNAARQLLLAFITQSLHTQDEGGAEFSEPVVRAMRFLRDHWGHKDGARLQNPTLGELARAASVSPGHLCRLFAKDLGCGPMEALRLIRVDHAASLLARTNLRVKEVSDRAGFENPFHFSRCFREAYGISPRAFKERARKGEATPASRVVKVRRMARLVWK